MKNQNRAIFYQVKSSTIKDKKYNVVHLADGSWKCQCWPFIKKGVCKHIDFIKNKYTENTE